MILLITNWERSKKSKIFMKQKRNGIKGGENIQETLKGQFKEGLAYPNKIPMRRRT